MTDAELPGAPAGVVDVHVHLVGVGQGGTGCHVSKRMQRSLVFQVLKRMLKMDPQDPQADRKYVDDLGRLVRAAPGLGRVVLLALDGVYDGAGTMDLEASHSVVPNEYLFKTCRGDDRFLPGPSINPMKAGALEELERCIAGGMVLLKWLAPLMHFDPEAACCDPFYETLARHRVPILAHTGCEHTFPGMNQELGLPSKYVKALEAGCTVIMAHCGVACPIHMRYHAVDDVVSMMDRYPNLYADTAALCSLLKWQHLGRLPFDRLPGRFLHGSDYPIPPVAVGFVRKLGLGRMIELTRHPNPLQVDLELKAVAGVPDHVYTSPSRVLGERIALWDRLRGTP